MNKATFKLACIIALLSISSLFGAQALPLDLAKEREIVALINQISKQVRPLTRESELSDRQWLNAQGESILILPTQYIEDGWQIPLDSGLQKFAGTPLEVIVPYVLGKLGASLSMSNLPTPRELFQRKISLARSIKQMKTTELKIDDVDARYVTLIEHGYRMYYEWALKSDNVLTFNRWIDGQRKICDGQKYQCRDGLIVCEDDLDLARGLSFEQYCDMLREYGLMPLL